MKAERILSESNEERNLMPLNVLNNGQRANFDVSYVLDAFRKEESAAELRVAAYIRVSTELLDQENSYITQEQYFRKLITGNPRWKYVGIYSDYGLSGTGTADRIGFRRLIRHCKEGKIDRIVCKSISRFARNTADFSRTILQLRSWHVTIFFEKENLDSADLQNDFILSVLGAFTQEESRSISSNVKDGIRMNMSQGNVPNVAMYGYRFTGNWLCTDNGYEYREVEIVPKEAHVVQTIFEKVAAGKSFTEIVKSLNAQGIPAPDSNYNKVRKAESRKGQLNSDLDDGWKSDYISKMVRNERYMGDVLTQKTYTSDYLTHKVKVNKGEIHQYYIKDHHPAIVDRELYEKVQTVLKVKPGQHPKPEKKSKSIFQHKIICGKCGRFYCRFIRNGKKMWRCPTATRNNGLHLCEAENIDEESTVCALHEAIFRDYGLDQTMIHGKQDAAEKERKTIERYSKKRIKALFFDMQKRIERIVDDDYVERDRSLYKGRLAEIDEALNHYAAEIMFLENRVQEAQELLRDNGIAENKKFTVLRKKQRKMESEYNDVTKKLSELEEYWKELENDYELRVQALQWISTLLQDKGGLESLLQGMTSQYFKAFVLDITVYSHEKFKIRWFDDRCTKVNLRRTE